MRIDPTDVMSGSYLVSSAGAASGVANIGRDPSGEPLAPGPGDAASIFNPVKADTSRSPSLVESVSKFVF